MADAVQAAMEHMIPELEELQEKKLFSAEEVHQIVTQRRAFEYQLRRQPLHTMDGLRYIAYELNLDALRKKRKARLGLQKPLSSDVAGIKRVHAIFDRLLYKQRGNMELWLQYIAFCKLEQSSRVLSQVFTRALQSHPRSAVLWIEAASYEFSVNLHVDTARVLMQRALRINPHERKLWLEYFRLELLFIQKLKMRRKILGLDDDNSTSLMPTDRANNELTMVIEELPEERASATGGSHVDDVAVETKEQQAKRSLVLDGAIPRIVYQSAIAAIPEDVDFRLEFVAICDLFGAGFAGNLSDFIVKASAEAFAADENVRAVQATRPLVVLADRQDVEKAERQCIASFEQAIVDVTTVTMKEKFAHWIIERVTASDRTAFMLEFAGKRLKQLATSGADKAASSTLLCTMFVDFVHRTDGATAAITEIQTILSKTNIKSASLWLLYSQLVLYGATSQPKPTPTKRSTKRRRTSDQYKEKSVLQRATEILEDALEQIASDDQDGLFQIYERLLEVRLTDEDASLDAIKQTFEDALKTQSRDSTAWTQLREQYIAWSAVRLPLASVRSLYRHFLEDVPVLPTPTTQAFVTQCIDIETTVGASQLDTARVRQLFERLLDLFGLTQEDVWMNYIAFFQQHQQFQDANAIVHRALRVWPSSLQLQAAMAGLDQ